MQAFLLAGVAAAGAAVAVVREGSELAPTIVAALPRRQRRRRRRRRFTAVAALMTFVGRLQETVTIWRPAAWPNTTRALRPLAKQRSYSAEKSAVEQILSGRGHPSPSTHGWPPAPWPSNPPNKEKPRPQRGGNKCSEVCEADNERINSRVFAVNGISPYLAAFPAPTTATQPPHQDVGKNAAAVRDDLCC